MTKPRVLVTVLTDAETRADVFCERFLRFLFEQRELAPEIVGNYEPLRQVVATWKEALSYCEASPFLWVRKHRNISQGSLFHTGAHGAGTVSLTAAFEESRDWLSFFRQLISVTKAHYGYVHLLTDDEWSETRLEPSEISDFRLGAIAKTLEDGFVDLGWANYFGPRWKAKVNPIKLASNAVEMQHVDEGYLFSITPTISEVKTNYDLFDRRRELIKGAFSSGFFRPAAISS